MRTKRWIFRNITEVASWLTAKQCKYTAVAVIRDVTSASQAEEEHH